jgi:mitogen-activated protein kinase kinase
MEFCEAGSLDSLYKKVQAKGWRTGEKVLGKIAESVSYPFFSLLPVLLN